MLGFVRQPLLFLLIAVPTAVLAEDKVSFARDIRGLLATNCFECHGPDEGSRKEELRLDSADFSREDRGGYSAIVPGDAVASELVKRIFDEKDPMPPRDSTRSLSKEEKELLRRWIEEGAEYEPHWGFSPPERPSLPEVKNKDWVRNPVDHFVLARLESEEMEPSAQADRYQLARRVSLDLTGLPPSVEEAEAFAKDSSPDAYKKFVDRLLASPRYGERWARPWLDLARYSDTNGYEKDRERSIWPYRDWVIDALNRDLPYDEFTIEQLAGDMLPNATPEQVIATGFHRNTMLNEEGGIDPLEFRYHAMVDRVATTGTVWMGLTTGCAQCHTHKYDPITHTDYFSLFALLNNADEPQHEIRDEAFQKRVADHRKEVLQLEGALVKKVPDFTAKFAAWRKQEASSAVAWETIVPSSSKTNLPLLSVEEEGRIFASGDFTKRDVYELSFTLPAGEAVTSLRLEAIPDPRLPDGGSGIVAYEGRKGNFFLSELDVFVGEKKSGIRSSSFSHGSGKTAAAHVYDGIGSSGWQVSDQVSKPHHLVLNFAEQIPGGSEIRVEMLFERHFSAALGSFRFAVARAGEAVAKKYSVHADGTRVEGALGTSWEDLSPEDRQLVRRAYLLSEKEFEGQRKALVAKLGQEPRPSVTLVMRERPEHHPRPTQRHHRGEYSQPKEAVKAAVPAIFSPLPDDAPADRLALARWLVSDANPLASRVAVNRAWQAFFGRGIVRTTADFGVQASEPSHPLLLDWLATEFSGDLGWSQKRLHRLIVTSATYRQRSEASEALMLRDPENVFLARGPRFRVEGEMVRDIGLAVSGLLHEKQGGRSVYPPQPAAVMKIAYGGPAWRVSNGPDRYRRSLYTFSKRTAPFAAYSVFDAPSGEACIARRNRSNTPLQSLTLLNDGMFLEFSRGLASRVEKELPEGDAKSQITRAFRHSLIRPPTERELEVLLKYHAQQLARLQSGELKHAAIFPGKFGGSPERAALAMVCRVLLNLDETITKP